MKWIIAKLDLVADTIARVMGAIVGAALFCVVVAAYWVV